MAGPFLTRFAKLLVILVVMTFAVLGAAKYVGCAVEAAMAPHHALPAERLYG